MFRVRQPLVLAVLAALLGPSAASAADCPQMQFIGVRGSGQNTPAGANGSQFFGPDIGAVLSAVNAQVPGTASQRGVGNVAVDYPAIAAQPFSRTFASRYVKSVRAGSGRLDALIKGFATSCPNTPIVLAGYSQGAQVIQRYIRLRRSVPKRVIGIALLGDPLFRQTQGDGIGVGNFDSNLGGVARFRTFPHLVDPATRKYAPAFGGPARWPANLRGRIISLCMGGDPICGPRFSSAEAGNCVAVTCNHFKYPTAVVNGVSYTTYAANFLVAAARPKFTPPPTAASPAPAQEFPYQVTGTCRDGCGLTVRGGTPGPSGALLGSIPDGTTVGVRCQTRGTLVQGSPGANDVWDQIIYNGQIAYVADLYLNTPGGINEGSSHFSPGIPRC